MSSASNIDPDIAAAFNNTPPIASSHSNIDPDIQHLLSPAAGKEVRPLTTRYSILKVRPQEPKSAALNWSHHPLPIFRRLLRMLSQIFSQVVNRTLLSSMLYEFH